MADSTTTGSAVVGGLVGGLQKGLLSSANGADQATDKVLIVYGTPQNVVTASVGSQLAYDLEAPDVYMAVAQGGSEWQRLGSLT